jgi:serine-type D-Ala-D-Ala carboxypeptidase (penicillin-binding protein 5/6)
MTLASGMRGIVACALLLAASLPARTALGLGKGDYVSAVVVAADTGEILIEHNPDAHWDPASLVKMMLSLIARERAGTTTLNWRTPIHTSAYASKMGGSQVYLKHGEVFTLAEMLQAIEIASANDACVAVAEAIAGSTDAAVQLMNAKASSLGMDDTRFVNVHGLPASSGKPANATTAHDIAILARALVVRHPDILATASTLRAPFRAGKFILDNTNKHFLRAFDGADGLKTGYHKRAKFNIAATAQRGDIRLIAVVLGAESTKDRTREASRLLNHVFANYKRDTVMDEGERLPDRVYVEGSAHEYAPLQVAGSLSIFAKRGDFARVRIVPLDVPVFEAPVAQGTPAGVIVAKLGDRELGRVPLVVAEPIERAPILWRVWHWRTPRPTRGRFLPAVAQAAGSL